MISQNAQDFLTDGCPTAQNFAGIEKLSLVQQEGTRMEFLLLEYRRRNPNAWPEDPSVMHHLRTLLGQVPFSEILGLDTTARIETAYTKLKER